MVVPLVDICLQTVQEAIESGKIQRLHSLPPTLRQRVLDTVLLRGDISNPNCLDALSSVEFLDGMTSVNTQAAAEEKSWRDDNGILPNLANQYVSDINDSKYLDRLAESLGKDMSNGVTLGAEISKLSLNIYLLQGSAGYQLTDVNFDSAIRLIARCPKLKSLDLRFVRYRVLSVDQSQDIAPNHIGYCSELAVDCAILNQTKRTEPCKAILEGLAELSIVSSRHAEPILVDKPILNFKKLEKLRLSYCSFDPKAWENLLMITKETLTELEAVAVRCFWPGGDLLPYILPNLKIFKAVKSGIDQDFVNNLIQCQKLENVFLEMDIGPDHPDLSPINRIRANVDIKATAAFVDKDDESKDTLDFDDGTGGYNKVREDKYFGRKKRSRLAAVQIFGSKVKKVDLVTEHWSKRLTGAITHVVKVCQNLTSLEIGADVYGNDSKELRKANRALAPLFSNPERASKLTKLRLSGDFSSNVLESIFENCINLRKFLISDCEQLNNLHLMAWANQGGWLITLEIKDCRCIGDNGLIPIINNSGSGMTTFVVRRGFFDVDYRERITDLTWRVLIDRCRYLKKANIPRKFKDLQREKGFLKKLELDWSWKD